MGIFESSTLSITNLEPTTSTLSSNIMPGTTTLGASTTTGALWVVDTDKDGNKYVNPKKLAGLIGTTATTSTSTSLNLNSAMAEENKVQAAEMGITAKQEKAVQDTRNIEEWFESLSDEEQLELLASVDQKLAEVQNGQIEEKVPTKHL